MLRSPMRKRKEPEGPDGFRAPPEPAQKPKPVGKPAGNRLLAGYLAHEFLTGGTLFGKPFTPAAAAAQPKPSRKTPPSKAKAYADVAELMMGDGGAHVPGVVNPSQLAQWLQM
ncbi:uncharacterized protein M6B38_361700 [Iris pallida]|uniref:Embryo sac development arrest 6 n=1 Tax=Iris pallida TaxID=29817 RepID=A0AAX6GJE1_IRIPA|nr:uncharacterized protein M6B38_361700 [Iris pallida]